MALLQLAHAYNPPHDRDGGPGDRWVVAYVKAEEARLLRQGQQVRCARGAGAAFPCVVEAINARAGVDGQYVVVLDSSK